MQIDGVYLHGHEGYLLDQLTNPAFNRRKLGRFADWQRFGLDLVREVRTRTGPDYPIMYRIELTAARGLEDFEERLCALPGIGPWTAQYVALRAFGEPDAFPAGDLGLRRALEAARVPTGAAALRERAQSWSPFRAYATLHLWNSLASDAGGEKKETR